LVFGAGFGLAFGFGFSCDFTGFIGSPQQTISVVSQPHGSSTRSTSPQSSHWYLSPFLFAKKLHLPKTSLYYIVMNIHIKISKINASS
jgi:hypothetical protein